MNESASHSRIRVRAVTPCAMLAAVVTGALSLQGCGDEAPPPQPQVQAQDPELASLLAQYDNVPKPTTNVLLITMDSVRQDYLSCYGHRPKRAPDHKTTPHVDRVAAEGVLFEDYRSNTSWTLPSHMSLMTGQPDMIHGVESDQFALHPSRPTMAAVLQKVGYRTAGFYSGPYCHERFRFDAGMTQYEAAYGPSLREQNDTRARMQVELDTALAEGDGAQAEKVYRKIRDMDLYIDNLSHKDRSSMLVTDLALGAISAARAEGKPWFVFAHYFDPHYDYDPPHGFAERCDPDYTGDIDGKNYFRNTKIGTHPRTDPAMTLRDRVCSDRDLEHIQALYEAEIEWTDGEIGRLLEQLDKQGVLDQTLVIITADHGEEFFEHEGIGHRNTLYEEQLRVPMVMRLPGVLPAGKRVRGLCSHPDVLPTVLEILNLPSPGKLNGRSVLPLVSGTDDGSGRYVLGRLMQMHPLTAINGPKIVRNTLLEVFLTGDIKVFRARRWPKPMDDCPPERAAKVREAAVTERQADFALSWIDLTKHPAEAPEDMSLDFGDPRAAAALEQFQRVYAELQAQPAPFVPAVGGRAMWLVYQNPQQFALMTQPLRALREDFLFPPPGM